MEERQKGKGVSDPVPYAKLNGGLGEIRPSYREEALMLSTIPTWGILGKGGGSKKGGSL